MTVCNVAQGDTGVSNPVASAEEPDEASSATFSHVGSADGGSLLHKVVWCLFLHFLYRDLDWHCDTLWCARQLKHSLSLLTISSRFWWSVTESQVCVGCAPLQNTHTGPFSLPELFTPWPLAPIWKAPVVVVVEVGLYGSCNPDSRILISFCWAATKSDCIHWLLECSPAKLHLTSVVSFHMTMGTEQISVGLLRLSEWWQPMYVILYGVIEHVQTH